jgi:hypothetical protein
LATYQSGKVPILAKEEFLLEDKCGDKFKPLLLSKEGAFFMFGRVN